MAETKVYVITKYVGDRLPTIREYDDKPSAKAMIKATLQWGIEIAGCRMISEKKAQHLLQMQRKEDSNG